MMSLNTPFKEIKREVKKVLSTNFFYLHLEFLFHIPVPLGFLQELEQTYLIGILIFKF
jgi:hypothetical protein